MADAALAAAGFLLDRKLVLVERGGVTGSHGDAFQVVVTMDELPMNEQNLTKNFNQLFRKCMKKELDIQRYCIACYGRSLLKSQTGWDADMWRRLCEVAREVSSSTLLHDLVEVADSSSTARRDLWGDLYSSEGSKNSLVMFAERLSGWSGDGVQVPPEMLSGLVVSCSTSQQGRSVIVQTFKSVSDYMKKVKKVDDIMRECGMMLDGLDALLTYPLVGEMVAEGMDTEILQATQQQGDLFETSAMFSGLLGSSLLIPKPNPLVLALEKYSCFRTLPNFPDVRRSDAESCFALLQQGLHRCQKLVNTVLLKVLRSAKRSSAVGWLAAVVSLNEGRTGPRFKRGEGVAGTCSDGYMVNFCAVILELCKPFFTSSPSGPKLSLIYPDYPSSPFSRLDLHGEPCFAQTILSAEERLKFGPTRFSPDGSPYKFVCECFFVAQRALHVGLIPALNSFTMILSDLNKEIAAEVPDRNEKLLKELNALYLLTGTCCLLDPQLVQDTSQFYITQSVWIINILEKCSQEGGTREAVEERQRKVMSGLPEFCVRDMTVWFRVVALMRPILLQGLQVTPFVDCCVTLLERPDLLPNPLAQSRIVSVLLAFVDSDQRGPQAGRLLGAQSWGGILGELSAIVQASPTVRDHLGPALLHTYAEVNVVEGLDVDKEDFDKFATRFEIARLLLRLWQREDCRQSILKACGGPKFQAFLGAIYDTLLYQLNDGLSRLVNVRQQEVAKDKGQWGSLPAHQRREKEGFLAGEKRASRGFILQANKQLELLDSLSEMEVVAQCLCRPPLARRTAAAMLGFLEVLCGSKASELNVKDKEKYNFDPKKLLSQIAAIILRVWAQECRQREAVSPTEGFLVSFSTHPDFTQSVVDRWTNVLTRHSLLDPPSQRNFSTFLEEVGRFRTEVETAEAMDTSHSSSGPDGAASGNRDDDWQTEAEAEDTRDDDLREFYQAALEGSKYDSAELQDVHLFASKAQGTLDPRSVSALPLGWRLFLFPHFLVL
jgi:hypothetical protein